MLSNLFVRNHGQEKHGSDYEVVIEAKNKGIGRVVKDMYRNSDKRTAKN